MYAFVEFDYNPSVYEIQDVSGWELVQDNGGQAVYSYSSGGSMNEVDINGAAVFSGTLTCISDRQTFQTLDDEDFVDDVTEYAISTSICSSGNVQAWADYQNGGNE